MSQNSTSESPTIPEGETFDVSDFSKELQMVVSFAILDLDIVRDDPYVAA